MGDGIMALFGAPLAHEDHAVRACYAALRMQDSVKRYSEDIRRTEGLPVQIRVGLNSGDVVVRSIGSDLRMDYTAVGQTTHLAARMEQMAMPGSILVPEQTLALAEDYVVVTPLGPMPVKGLDRPIDVYEMTGATSVRSRLHAAAARGLTRFVGRDAELEQLREALDRARAGRGQVVAVVGEPGVGKSRLYWEFTHSHRTHDWLILESGSVSYGKATAFLPIIDLLRSYFQVEPGDDGRKIREKATGKLLSLDRALEPALPALLWLLDVPEDDPAWQRLDPAQRRQRTLDGVKRLLLRESRVQPLVVMFEDLHWIDAETQALLDGLVESLPTARVLLLVNYRPEYRHDWGGKTYYRQLRIDPLPPESASTLLHGLLGDDPALDVLKRLVIERTEGNPFFLEESVRTLVETGVLVGERGAYRLAKVSQTLQIPATAQAILAARVDRLSSEDKRLLQAASVIGKDVPFALLQAIAGVDEDALRAGLARLQAAEFLYEARLFPDLEYTFKHALTHEVTYGSLLQERRCALHRHIVDAIEALYPDRRGEHIEQLADHAFRGAAWDRALRYLRQAGSRAEARSALREAVSCFERALTALERQPDSRETTAQAIDIRLDLQGVLYPLAGIERTLHHLREAESLAEGLGDRTRLGRVSAHLTYCFYWMGDLDGAVASGERALALATDLGDFAMQVSTNTRLGQVYFAAGQFGRAADLFRWTIAQLEGDLSQKRFGLPLLASGICRDRLGWCLAARGEFAEARATVEQGIRLSEAANHSYTLGNLYCSAGWIAMLRGDFQGALAWLERGRDLSRSESIPLLAGLAGWRLGEACALGGRIADGVALLEEAADQLATMGHTGYYPRAFTALAAAYRLAGRPADARQMAERALAASRTYKQPAVEAEALRVLGDIESADAASDLAGAAAAYRQALVMADERGMRPLAAHCHAGLADVCRRTGDAPAAGAHLMAATAAFRDLDMEFYLAHLETPRGLRRGA
jgi:tetratricopeptide (TPR) repeat protein